MKWRIEWTRTAVRDLRRLDRQAAARVRAAVQRLAEAEQGNVRRLTGRPDSRLRVGDLRVIFEYDYASRTLRVRHVVPRDQAYRD